MKKDRTQINKYEHNKNFRFSYYIFQNMGPPKKTLTKYYFSFIKHVLDHLYLIGRVYSFLRSFRFCAKIEWPN